MMKFVDSIKNTDEIYSAIKRAYQDANIPLPYPAANKHLQSRLHEFVAKGLMNDQSVSNFGKVNSNRIYTLEKQNDMVQLIMQVEEKDQATKKLVVLPVDDEIKLIVNSFINIFEETGFIESAPKCHKRLRDTYAISDGRIRIVQRILAKYVTSASIDNAGGDEDGKQTNRPVKTTRSIPNDENLPPLSIASGVTTRSISNDENLPPLPIVSGVTTRSISNDENLPPLSIVTGVTTRSKSTKNVREQNNGTKNQVRKKKKN